MYSLTERAAIGGECEYSEDLHIHPLFAYTELLDLKGGYKEMVSTGFTNYAMPFIRYRTGDIVTDCSETCNKCGRNHIMVGNIEGRADDFLVGRSGEIIPRLMPWIRIFQNVRQFQFLQEEQGRAYLKIVKAKEYSDGDTHIIKSKLEDMLGPMKNTIAIEIVFVENIPPLSSGKIKMVEQKLEIRKLLET
jgi:phenylacetate-CoA ligase